MTLKLKSLLEGYAWERRADGSLPTLRDAIAVHEANSGVKPDYIDLDKDGNTEEPMKSAAKEVNEYGQSNGDVSEIVEKLEDYVDRLMQDLSTNPDVPTSEKSVILRQLVNIADLIDELQDNI